MNACEQPAIRKPSPSPALVLVGFLFLAGIAQAVVHGMIPLPRCLLLQFTGIPCPTCGSTRSLAAWTQLDLASAFLFNPLFFAACTVLLLWSGIRLVEIRIARELVSRRHFSFSKNTAWALGAASVILNWLYLCLTLPR
jgi:hypothetical protein